jgi:CobQ-like glutamine amidotransferase family enzyme
MSSRAGEAKSVRIAHLFPELLNLYGDGGNILTLRKRCEWRGIGVDVIDVRYGERPSFSDIDLVFIGGGSDREQAIVCEQLLGVGEELRAFVEDDGVLLAVCGGYQLLGHSYLMGEERLAGLSLVDIDTDRGTPRLIGNVEIVSDIQDMPIVGYENHGGRTTLGPGVKPLGTVVHGWGNDGVSGAEGCRYRNVVGTYIHGPLLPKNPGVADWLIERALERRYGTKIDLEPLDDAEERAANAVMCARLDKGGR